VVVELQVPLTDQPDQLMVVLVVVEVEILHPQDRVILLQQILLKDKMEEQVYLQRPHMEVVEVVEQLLLEVMVQVLVLEMVELEHQIIF
tara:strand:+ start:339 stop:605 length:267 start_codon:yes stop_codon:yes gene_type:complete